MNLLKTVTDPRVLQILILSTFLTYGCIFLQWQAELNIYLSAFLSCLTAQCFWINRLKLPFNSLLSALISAIGLCLLLKVNHWSWMFLAGIITISSKFLIRVDGKHLFNPTNFGIIAIILLNLGWVSPGQWGSDVILALFLFFAASTILFGVKRWDVAITFIVALFLLELVRNVLYLGWPLDFLLHKFQNGTLLLFAFFMITDPRTAPNHRKSRIIWAVALAILSFVLSQFYYFYKAPLIALFIFSAAVPFLNRLYNSPQFSWRPNISKL